MTDKADLKSAVKKITGRKLKEGEVGYLTREEGDALLGHRDRVNTSAGDTVLLQDVEYIPFPKTN